jgi:hypothetical protein
MFFGDHAPPHFHAKYEGTDCLIDIQRLGVIAGDLPPRALGLVMEWATLHREELMQAWERAQQNEAPGKIDPLQ